MKPGDPVWYRQVTPGGDGHPANVPATFVRRTLYRITIRVPLRDGGERVIHVAPSNIRAREASEGPPYAAH